ncbi:oocyst capsule protein Cap380 [Plasmodium brasilianum]|uniref:Oocyst capsule protein Cap380 n=1 Tax=Plasmodium brasilianum TaxID=5824 RepID=A0ACB9YBZ4_PLABR|nr:oocyst capsule protein Cap380 [Plasmodium brasilianum]
MHRINIFYVLFVGLLGMVHSSLYKDLLMGFPYGDEYDNMVKEPRHSIFKNKRFNLDINSFGNTCILNYKEVCETANYSINVNHGISDHEIKVMLVQKESSDIISVHTLTGKFSIDGNVSFLFNNIPSLHYNIILEVADLIHNTDYDIGVNCYCEECSDNVREIDLSLMDNQIIHKVRSDSKNKLTFPQKPFVNGQYLFSKYLFFHSEINLKTVENYDQLYNNYYELVTPCSGLIMNHSEQYNINYDMSSVHCYHVYLVNKFMKKINSNGGDNGKKDNLKFVTPVYIQFDKKEENFERMIDIIHDYTIPSLPLKYENSYYVPRETNVRGSLVRINTSGIFSLSKYIYKNNRDNRMEYVHMFRIFFQLFKKFNNISDEQMLQYTTGLHLQRHVLSSAYYEKLGDTIYAEELAVLLNSLAFEFNADAIGLNRNVLMIDEKQFVSKYGNASYAHILYDQLVLKQSQGVCLLIVESIAHELSSYINNKLKKTHKTICNTLRRSNSYSNITTMFYTYELDCNMTLFYKEHYVDEDIMIRQLITNKTLLEDVQVELLYEDIFEYVLIMHATIDKRVVQNLKTYVSKYINNDSMITITVVGRKSDRTEANIDVELKKITFSINCAENCTNSNPILIEHNYDYVFISTICVENSNLRTICFPQDGFSYIFDTRLLRVHMISINPYPEPVLTVDVHRTIVENLYCVLFTNPNMIPHENALVSYRDSVCKEYLNRCKLLTTKIFIKNVVAPASIFGVKDKLKLSFSTHFDEKHEEMIQIIYYSKGNTINEHSYIVTHYSDSLYVNEQMNKIVGQRKRDQFKLSSGEVVNNMLIDDDNFYKSISSFHEKEYNVDIYHTTDKYTLIQTTKWNGNDLSLYPFGEISINYEKIKTNVFMKFLHNYIYYYNKKEKYDMATFSPYFVNVSPYNYECLGAYAYLMNKFNILVNDSLNCEALHIIIEVLLKANLGKYFIHNKNKIHLNFYKHPGGDAHTVFDMVYMEIYEPHAPLEPFIKHKLNVSIDENNLNLLYSHRNVQYINKYFSNMYVLLFKVAYLSNQYDFYTFFYDLTGIRLIDDIVMQNLDKLDVEDQKNIQNIHSLLNQEYKISIAKHTEPSEKLINEISLLAAYIVELTSSYRKKLTHGDVSSVSRDSRGDRSTKQVATFAEIKYFVYVNEFKYGHSKKYTINEIIHRTSKYNALVIKKKILCCSNFVDEVENALKFFILYKYVLSEDRFVPSRETKTITKAHNIIQKLLERSIPCIDYMCEEGSSSDSSTSEGAGAGISTLSELNRMVYILMDRSGYVSRKIPTSYIDLKCINLDMANYYESIITSFKTTFDLYGALVTITMNKLLPDISIRIGKEMDNYLVYFLFRNLSVPFMGKTHRTETLELRRLLLLRSDPIDLDKDHVMFNMYVDSVDGNSLFMLEKIIFVSKGGDKLVKEVNVEYETFFVHPHNMISKEALTNKHISAYEKYYNKVVGCDHYNNGLQVCAYHPAYDYEGFTPFYVSYLENNQRKDILFKKNEDIANLISNGPVTLSKRYNIQVGGDRMLVDIYNSVQIIAHEIVSSIGINNFDSNFCGTLQLNNGHLHTPNDKDSLISNIFYDTTYCLNKGAVFRKILEVCKFRKEELERLFSIEESNILPYHLNENFAKLLTQKELLGLIFYFISVPPQVNQIVRGNLINLEISELVKSGKQGGYDISSIVEIENNGSVNIERSYLTNVNKHTLAAFNTAFYTQLIEHIQKSNKNSNHVLVADPSAVQNYMQNYINSNNSCNSLIFTNSGPLSLPEDVLTYNNPSFSFIDDKIYIKKKPDTYYAFNNFFLYEGQNYLKEKYLSAILVLSPYKFASINDVIYIDIIANSFDNKNQFVLNCYPRRKYNTSFFEKAYNIQPKSVYFVCKNLAVMYLKNGLYEFNRYLIQYREGGSSSSNGKGIQVYENMPVRPIYEVKNNNIIVPNREDVHIELQRVNNRNSTNIIEYLIHVKGPVSLHLDPYVVVKPIFTRTSYLYNTKIHITDDYLTYMYPRKLKYSEFIKLPMSKDLFKDKTLTLLTVKKSTSKNNFTYNIYSLAVVKSLNLTSIIVKDLFNNEFVINVDEEKVVREGGVNTVPEVAQKEKEESRKEVSPTFPKPVDADKKDNPLAENHTDGNYDDNDDDKKKKKACGAFFISIESSDFDNGRGSGSSNDRSIPTFQEQYFFMVFSTCVIREGLASLTISGNRYHFDVEAKHLMNENIFNEIYKKINDEVKLYNGRYIVSITRTAFRNELMPEVSEGEKKIIVQRVNKDGTVYIKHNIYGIGNEKNGFHVDIFSKNKDLVPATKEREATKPSVKAPVTNENRGVETKPKDRTPYPVTEAVVDPKSKPKLDPAKKDNTNTSIIQRNYMRTVQYMINIEGTTTTVAEVDKPYIKRYIMITNLLYSSNYKINVINGNYTGICEYGFCYTDEEFLENLIDDREIANGTFKVSIEKHVFLTKYDESEPRSESKIRRDIVKHSNLVCLVKKEFSLTIDGLSLERTVESKYAQMEKEKETTTRKRSYYAPTRKEQKQVVQLDNDSLNSRDIVEWCTYKEWNVDLSNVNKHNVKLMDKAKESRTSSVSEEFKSTVEGRRMYHPLDNVPYDEIITQYIDNDINLFEGSTGGGVGNSKYIVQFDNRRNYRILRIGERKKSYQAGNRGHDGHVGSTENTQNFNHDEKHFAEFFKLLNNKPMNELYFLQMVTERNALLESNNDIVLNSSPIYLNSSSNSSTYKDEGKGQNDQFLVEIIGSDENDTGMLYTEMFIVHGYYLDEGTYYIELSRGIYTITHDSVGHKNINVSDIENLVNMSGRKLDDDSYEIYVERVLAVPNAQDALVGTGDGKDERVGTVRRVDDKEDGLIFDNIRKDLDSTLDREDSNKRRKTEFHEIIPDREREVHFRSYIHLHNDGHGNRCSFSKIIDGKGKGIAEGKYFVNVLNGSYNTTIVRGPKIDNYYIKLLLNKTWTYEDNIRSEFYIDIFIYDDKKGGNIADSNNHLEYDDYYVSIKPLSSDNKDIANERNVEYVKIQGAGIRPGVYEIEMSDNKYNGKDEQGNVMDRNFAKNIMLLCYERAKNGRYHVVIMDPKKSDSEAVNKNSGVGDGDGLPADTVLTKEISKTVMVQKMYNTKWNNGLLTLDVKFTQEGNIQDGIYNVYVFADGTQKFTKMIAGRMTEFEAKELQTALKPYLESGIFEIQIVENKLKEKVSRTDRLHRSTISGRPYDGTSSVTSHPTTSYDHQSNNSHISSLKRSLFPPTDEDRVMTHYQDKDENRSLNIFHCSSFKSSNCRNIFKNQKID